MSAYHHIFQGTATEFTLANFMTILLLTLVYALLTGWVVILFFRFLLPLVDSLGRRLLGVAGLFPLLVFGFCAALWLLAGEAAQGVLLFVIPILVFAMWLGYGQTIVLMPLVLLVLVGAFWLLWYPVGEWTGIGWVGVIPYAIFTANVAAIFRA